MSLSTFIRTTLLSLLISMISFAGFLSALESNGKGYLAELEEAFASKIEADRAGRGGNAVQGKKPVLKVLGDGSEVGAGVVQDIQATKESLISFLATNELISWEDLKNRFILAKRSMEAFEAKYQNQVAQEEEAEEEVVAPAGMPMPSAEEDEEEQSDEAEEASEEEESEGDSGMPGLKPAASQKQVKTGVPGAHAGMPGAQKGMMPRGVVGAQKPGQMRKAMPQQAMPQRQPMGMKQLARPAALQKPMMNKMPASKPVARPVMGGMPMSK